MIGGLENPHFRQNSYISCRMVFIFILFSFQQCDKGFENVDKFLKLKALEIMRYALIVIEQPKRSLPADKEAWNELLDILSGTCAANEQIERPNEYVLSVPLQNAWCDFVGILHALQERGFGYRVLFLEDPEWLYSEGT